MEKNELDKEKIKELSDYLETLDNPENLLIMILHKTQDLFGYLPKDILVLIAKKTKISLAKIYGVVTFYSYFNTEKKGKHSISVCMGTACFVKGAGDILDEIKKELQIEIGETSKDDLFTLEQIRCVGACGLAPVLSIDGKIYGNVKKEDVKGILESYKAGDK